MIPDKVKPLRIDLKQAMEIVEDIRKQYEERNTELVSEIGRKSYALECMKDEYERKISNLTQGIYSREFENLKLRSRVVDLENEILKLKDLIDGRKTPLFMSGGAK